MKSADTAPAAALAAQSVDQKDTAQSSQGLHSPPDSNGALKTDASDSELSDLDDPMTDPMADPEPENAPEPEPVDDIGEILPDHWSGTVPVFKPTMKQFNDFKIFMEKVDRFGMTSGIIKIIPPQEWKDSLPPLDDMIKTIRIREPIKQDIMGKGGTYRQVNIVHGRSYNLPQWRQLCDQSDHQPPARRGERRANADKKPATRSRPAPAPNNNTDEESAPKNRRRSKRGKAAKGAKSKTLNEPAADVEDRPMTPVSPRPKDDAVIETVEEEPGVKIEEDEEDDTSKVGRMGMRQPRAAGKQQSTSARRKYSKRESSAVIDEKAFEGFDYRMDISEYTPERCEELERTYWKTLTYAQPLYGADMMGTLFHEDTKAWNLNHLPSLLDAIGTKVPGVNTAYLYMGMWKATFAWHLEDVDLYSINYLHFGAPKQWYSISQADARRFEAAMKSIWPNEAKACDQFLRHKAFLVSPTTLLNQFNIRVNKCLSYPGEFVVTYPYGYHSGYNLGYNCAEAVNFALDTWLPMGKIAKRCECAQAQDSVWVDVYEIERRLRGEETEYEETDDESEEDDDDEEASGLPTPPATHSVNVKVKVLPKKRVKVAKTKDAQAKVRKVKKVKMRSKPPVEPPCCLCPNDIPGAEILPTDDGRKAHRMCALYIPETYIELVDDKEVVANVAKLGKDRLALKCLYCRSKKGACFQCSQKKCVRAYHATCAAAAGVFVEDEEIPIIGEDGTEYKEQAFEFSCRFHRTKRDKKFDGDALESCARIMEAAAVAKSGDIVQCQYYRSDIFAGVVVENRASEETLLLDIIPNGDRVEVEWKWLLVADPSDYHLPKASPNAKPMPTSRKAKEEINATKRPTEGRPRSGVPFVEGCTWAEFHTCKPEEAYNKAQVKVDMNKENQVWHYIYKGSTDTRPQYTENPREQRHNPKANFLDSIPKPLPPPPVVPLRQSLSATHPVAAVAAPSTTKPAKAEKPYVYKPRKPVPPTTEDVVFASRKFSVKSGLGSKPPGSHLAFGSDPRFATPNQAYASDRLEATFQRSPYTQASPNTQIPSVGGCFSSQPHSASHSQSSGHYTQSPGSQPPTPAGAVAYRQLSGTSWPRGISNMAPKQQVPAPSPHVRRPSVGYHVSPAAPRNTALLAPPTRGINPFMQDIMAKYSFFRINHTRDPTSYKTPYAPNGGFTNGYEGNIRAHLTQNPEALLGKNPIFGPTGVRSYASPAQKVPIPKAPLRPELVQSHQQTPAQATAALLPPGSQPAHHNAPKTHPPVPPFTQSQPVLNVQSQSTQAASLQAPQQPSQMDQVFQPWGIKRPGHGPLHPAIRPQYKGFHTPNPSTHSRQTSRSSSLSKRSPHTSTPSVSSDGSTSSRYELSGKYNSIGSASYPSAQSILAMTSPRQPEDKKEKKKRKAPPTPTHTPAHPAIRATAVRTATDPLPPPESNPVTVVNQEAPPLDASVDAVMIDRTPPIMEAGAPLVPDVMPAPMLEGIQQKSSDILGVRDFPSVEPNSLALVEKMMENLRKASERGRAA